MKIVNEPVDSNRNVARWKQQIKTKPKPKQSFDTIPDVHPTPKKLSQRTLNEIKFNNR